MSFDEAPQAGLPDLEAMFSDSDRFLNRFIWTLVLEPPRALQPSVRKSTSRNWQTTDGLADQGDGGIK